MPIYLYQAEAGTGCAYCTEPFERRHKIDAPRLAACPECGVALRRVITPPNLVAAGADLSESNVEKHGFTRYRRAGKGVYEKTAGQGPKLITDND